MTVTSPQVSIGKPAPKPVEFVRFEGSAPQRLVLSMEGLPKEGKTEFSLTAPGPIAVHNFDFGMEGVAEKYTDKELYLFEYLVQTTSALPGSVPVVEAARAVWESYVRNFRASLEQMRTVIVDTGSEAWNLVRLARLGKLTQVLPVQYTAVNSEFRQLTQLALSQKKCNVIFTHKLKPEYVNDKKTGNLEMQGFGEMNYDVQAVVRASRDYSKQGLEQFSLTIAECRLNYKASGTRFVGGDCTFQKVATAIYPQTKEEDWA